MLPKQYRPTKPEEFFGPSRRIAEELAKTASLYMQAKIPGLFLFHGDPGVGKTTLAKFALSCFNVSANNLEQYSGTDFNIETVRRWSEDIQQSSIFEGYRGLWVDEVDHMPKEAQVRFLKICDQVADGLVSRRNGVVIAATCNSSVEELEERFQSRFQVYRVKGPLAAEVEPLLTNWLDIETARALATRHADNTPAKPLDLRALLNDTTTLAIRKMAATA